MTTTALANLAKANADPLRHLDRLATQSQQAAAAWPAEYRAAVAYCLTVKGDDASEAAADAAVMIGREMLKNPPNDASTETVHAYCQRIARYALADALKHQHRDSKNRAARNPEPVTLDSCENDPAAPDSDPQNAYRWTLAGLANVAALDAAHTLRTIELDPVDDALRLPAGTPKEQRNPDRIDARSQITANDADTLPTAALLTVRRETALAMKWARHGWAPDTEHSRMTPRAESPSTGPATPVIEYRKNRTVARVDGLPWREARALLGLPDDATGEQVAAHALGLHAARPVEVATVTPYGPTAYGLTKNDHDQDKETRPQRSHIITHPTPDADAVPLAQVKRENADDKRAHEAAQPVKKPNPRKRPRSGRLGTSATIR